MNKAVAILLVLFTSWFGCLSAFAKAKDEAVFIMQPQEPVKKHEPEYAKWSRLAFQEAGKVYTLLDYKYLGRTDVAPGVAQQQFRFWVKKNGSEFPLIVSIRYNPITEKVYAIVMEQEKRGDLRAL